MTDDLELIKQLEKQIGRRLIHRTDNEILGLKRNGLSINEKLQVTGLNLCEIKLTIPALETLSKFSHLKILDFRFNRDYQYLISSRVKQFNLFRFKL